MYHNTSNRRIRIYISSAFQDMFEERDMLRKYVWPTLREFCQERHVDLVDVDLQWGISQEQSQRPKNLKICIDEISECFPYFIGILGESYGWIPGEEAYNTDLLLENEWIKDVRGKSLLEIEILHGVLNNPLIPKHAFFYFRDPKFTVNSSSERRDYGKDESDEKAYKMQRLKDEIRLAKSEKFCMLHDNYSNAQHFVELVLVDFKELIDGLFPLAESTDFLDEEALDHDAFSQSHLNHFVGRKEILNNLDRYVSTPNIPLILNGESGCGKSALLSKWVSIRYTKPDIIIAHYIGCSPESSNWQALVRRIISELKHAFNISFEIPIEINALTTALSDLLSKHLFSRNVILVLDGLDRLSSDEIASDFKWLPEHYPDNFHVIVSTLPGGVFNLLKERDWNEMTMCPLSTHEILNLTELYSRKFYKVLPITIVEKLKQSYAASNPLYLVTLLEEFLRVPIDIILGTANNIMDALMTLASQYLSANNPSELYELVLIRWEKDFDPNIVRNCLCLVWAARGGLSEVNLLNLMGNNEEPLPRAFWTPFQSATKSVFAYNSNGLSFANPYLSQAVEKRYLKSNNDRKLLHQNLVKFYYKLELPELKFNTKALKYLPFHACEADETDIWLEAMTDFRFLRTVVERVDVNANINEQGVKIEIHYGYFVIQDEIERWLIKHIDIDFSRDLILPFRQVWSTLQKEILFSTKSFLPVLYHNLSTIEVNEFYDRATKKFVSRAMGPIGEWCEKERMKYEDSSHPWVVFAPPEPPFEAYSGQEQYLFVSYSHKDNALVYPEIYRLYQLGFRIWYDEGIDPGNEWPEEVAIALDKCSYFLVFITTQSVESQNVKNEINFAINHKKPFLAIHIEETTLPKGLELRMGDIQAILKWRMQEDRYFRQMEKTLPISLLKDIK
jgi:hypothetical protein